jgi:hypothetical protein
MSTSNQQQQSASDLNYYYFGATHQQALRLEVDILTALLHRNRSGQGRTKYFQRCSMALQCLRRYGILELYSQLLQLLPVGRRSFRQESVECTIAATERQHEQRESISSSSTAVKAAVVKGLPECLDRLEFAAVALFGEISRGFFLPFCTTAVAATSRMRTLLLRLGRYGFHHTTITSSKSDDALSLDTAAVTAAAREVFFEWNEPVDFYTRSKADRSRSMLRSMGLAPSKYYDKNNDDETKMLSSAASMNGAPDKEDNKGALADEELLQTAHATHSFDRNADDIGKAVDQGDNEGSADCHQTDNQNVVDRNSEIVQIVKRQQKQERQHSAENASQGKKKKQKKTTKGGDFFDNIFGRKCSK